MNPAEKYILDREEPYRSILLQLQILIESVIPELQLKYSYKIPYYYYKGRPFCFLNVTKGYVDIGFRVGSEFDDLNTFLVSEKRKVFKSLRYRKVDEINSEILIEVMTRLHKIYRDK